MQLVRLFALSVCATVLGAQDGSHSALPPAPLSEADLQAMGSFSDAAKSNRQTGYVLGPGDQLIVRVVNLEDINDKPVQIDLGGNIRLPMVGQLRVSGLTVEEVAAEIVRRLAVYMKHPDVSVSVADFRSQPVSVIGAVKTPGVLQVQGQRNLLEMLSLAGGLDNATAGTSVKIIRKLEWGPIPVAGARNDATNQFSVAQISIKTLLDASHPEENIPVKPYDVISVPKGETLFVIGQVQKAGGFVMNDSDQITVLQALSMAGGLDKMAQPQHARILRHVPGASSRTEIPVDINKILDGKTTDVPMLAQDILFVPNSVPKRAAMRAIEAAIQMGTIAILRP